MTVLVLTLQRKLAYQLDVRGRLRRLQEGFTEINAAGIYTAAALAMIVIGAAVYLAAMLIGFNLGIRLGQSYAKQEAVDREARDLTVLARRREAELVAANVEILAGMRPVSRVRYLNPEGAAVSQISSGQTR